MASRSSAHRRWTRHSRLAVEQLEDRTLLDRALMPMLSLLPSASGPESLVAPQLAVALNAPAAQTVTVHYAVKGGTAKGGVDYTLKPGTLTFAPGDRVKDIPLIVVDHGVNVADKTVVIGLSSPKNAFLANATLTYTILNDVPPPTVSFTGANPTSGAEGTSATFTVGLSAPSGQTVTVGYAVTGGTATSGADYKPLAATLTFQPGQTSTTITLATLDDHRFEDDETVQLSLTNSHNAALGAAPSLTYTIQDNGDVPPAVSFKTTSAGGPEGQALSIQVALSRPAGKPVTVQLQAGGTAQAGMDYTLSSDHVTFAPGQSVAAVALDVLNTAQVGSDKTVMLTLASPDNATLANKNITFTDTITEGKPVVGFATASSSGPETQDGSLPVVLNTTTTTPITVHYAATGGTAKNGVDYTLKPGTLTFQPGQTTASIPFTVVRHTANQADKTLVVSLTGPKGAFLGAASTFYTIVNVVPMPTVSFGDGNPTSGTEGKSATFTVGLSAPSGQTVTVGYAVIGGTATSGADFKPLAATLTFQPGQTSKTITLATLDDRRFEDDETVQLSLTNPRNATLGATPSLTYTIQDNGDAPPAVAFKHTTASGPEGQTVSVQVVLSSPAGKPVTVQLQAGGTAQPSVDYTLASNEVTFAPGQSVATMTLDVLDTAQVGPDKTVVLTLASPDNATLAPKNTTFTDTITEGKPVLGFQITAPAITVQIPIAKSITSNTTVTGQVSDAIGLADIQSVQAAIDGGPLQPKSFDAQGNFSFSTGLATDGTDDRPHTIDLLVTDLGGKIGTLDVPFTLDTAPPTITITNPSLGFLTNQNFTITGQISDAADPVTLQAALDGGSFAGVPVDGVGNFTIVTRLLLDRSQDGTHTEHLKATDVAGNVRTQDVTWMLDTTPPATPTFDLAAGTVDLGPEATSAGRVTLVGKTDAGVHLSLVGTGLTSLASGSGTFQIPDVTLTSGANVLTVQATDPVGNTSQATLTVTYTPPTNGPSANAVIVWNQATLDAIQADASDPLVASRAMAMVQSAVFDAVSAIEGTPGYAIQLTAPAGTSAEAAVASAADTVLSYLYPAQQAKFDSLLATSLASIATGQPKTDGLALGQSAGNGIIALRATDGWNTFVDFVPSTGPGQWQPTPPMYMEAMSPQWATMQPWLMTADDQFRPAGPPALDSQAWADAFNEVAAYGSATSTVRTADETQIARFWSDGSGSYTPPGHWNQIAGQVAQEAGDSLDEDARLFAVLDITLADAAIAAWDAKYAYTSWRPVTAIPNAGQANNPDAQADPTWTPLLVTPNFPEYISGHSTFSAAAATVLDSFFGSSVSFSTTSATLPGVTRSFTSFDQAAAEAGQSRIYAGIHFQFSNHDGQATGRALADYALGVFNIAQDTTPPKIALDNVLHSGATSKDLALTGQVTDNLSGPASLTVQVDQQNVQTISLDASGRFSIPTDFPLDGSADGTHTLTLVATDFAGNASTPVVFSFVLDTQAPVISLTGPANNSNLALGATLSGTVTTTGAPITAFSYAFDGGTVMPVSVDATGGFSVALDLSRLSVGSHTLTVTAQDAAGNSASTTLNVTQPSLIPLTITSVTPTNGADDVGSTYRPKVIFSRPIDTTTLNANNFFATDTTGAKLGTTIVPSMDSTFAWLFPTNPMPGGSTITITVDGSTIRAGDGSLLDAAGTGTPGSKLTFQFTTVSLANLPGTSLSGIVADPGPDLKPMTFDDLRVGPDGVLMTADDVYLNPIANAKVYILGEESQYVYSDAQGHFNFASVPSGDIKLAIDGRTATNAPAGYYFPEMVMDLTIRPGQANTVMGSMGTEEEQQANAAIPGVYLPRVATSILQTVSNTAVTTIGVDAVSAPNLTPEQRQSLHIEVQPGSLIGADGQPMASGQVGISTVPPELVRDMLPRGLLQHTFDITIQAPGVSVFSTPLAMTFPNVFNAAPGSKMNFLSFDHTTGRLVIDGTATVSADGLSVTTDPGTGITHPGWHGGTGAGSNTSGGPANTPGWNSNGHSGAMPYPPNSPPGPPVPPLPPDEDTNGNGIPDYWEKPADPNDPNDPRHGPLQVFQPFYGQTGDVTGIDLSPLSFSDIELTSGPGAGGRLVDSLGNMLNGDASIDDAIYYVPDLLRNEVVDGYMEFAAKTEWGRDVVISSLMHESPGYSTTGLDQVNPGDGSVLGILREQVRLRFLGFPDDAGQPVVIDGLQTQDFSWAVGLFNAATTDSPQLVQSVSINSNWINAANAPRWENLLDEGFHFEDTVRTFGTSWAREVLQSAGLQWPYSTITAISNIQGGPAPPHRSHQAGMDIDINEPYTYDYTRTVAQPKPFFDTFDNGAVKGPNGSTVIQDGVSGTFSSLAPGDPLPEGSTKVTARYLVLKQA